MEQYTFGCNDKSGHRPLDLVSKTNSDSQVVKQEDSFVRFAAIHDTNWQWREVTIHGTFFGQY